MIEISYKLTRSKRKTISLGINSDLEIIVKAPLKMSQKDIENFVEKHSSWIEKHKTYVQNQNEIQKNHAISEEQSAQLKLCAKQILPKKVEHYSRIMQVLPASIKITSAATRWGSCSAKNGLCFPYRLMLLPEDLIDYIVVHELAHIRVKNHSAKFYGEIEKYMPDYKARIKKLKAVQREVPR